MAAHMLLHHILLYQVLNSGYSFESDTNSVGINKVFKLKVNWKVICRKIYSIVVFSLPNWWSVLV